LADFVEVSRKFDTAGFTATARVNLSFDDRNVRTKPLSFFDRLIDAECRTAVGHVNSVAAQDCLALVFVDIQGITSCS
jgi:hypothetical protein